jgi:hypothetical protein
MTDWPQRRATPMSVFVIAIPQRIPVVLRLSRMNGYIGGRDYHRVFLLQAHCSAGTADAETVKKGSI